VPTREDEHLELYPILLDEKIIAKNKMARIVKSSFVDGCHGQACVAMPQFAQNSHMPTQAWACHQTFKKIKAS
jgi:hypothetical protein